MISFRLRQNVFAVDEKFPLRMLVYRTRTSRSYINLKIMCRPGDWDAEREAFVIYKSAKDPEKKLSNAEHKKLNDLLFEYRLRAERIIKEFSDSDIDWTPKMFIDRFSNKPSKSGNVNEFLTYKINELKESGRHGTAITFERVLGNFMTFDKKFKSLEFRDIDIEYIKKLDRFFVNKKLHGNTRKLYHQTIHGIYKEAVKEKKASLKKNPYREDEGFSYSSLSTVTKKRYLPDEHLQKIKDYNGDNEKFIYARALFLLSYYMLGISFRDQALLETENIVQFDDGDYMVYIREKLKNRKNTKRVKFKITEQIVLLRDQLLKNRSLIKDYFLPIIDLDTDDAELMYKHLKIKYNRYLIWLNDFGKHLEIPVKLTSYVARHSMAMKLKRSGVATDVISEVMTHGDVLMTKNYLDSFETKVIDEAAKLL